MIANKLRKTYAIIGAGGFLGQHLIHLLLKNQKEDISIKFIDKLQQLNPSMLIYPDDFTNRKLTLNLGVDIANRDHLRGIFNNVDIIVHLAALIAYGQKNKEKLNNINVKGTQHVIEEAQKSLVKRMVYVSSFATLGCIDNQNKSILADENCQNDWKYDLDCYYGLSKYFGEQVAMSASNHELTVDVAMPGIMLGPGPSHHASILPFDIVLNQKIAVVPQGGTSIIDVRDAAAGIIKLIESNNKPDKYLFVSHNIEHRDLLSLIAFLAQRKIKLIEIPRYFRPLILKFGILLEWLLPQHSAFSKEGVSKVFSYRYFTCQKAQSHLEWSPQYSLEDTVQDTLNWLGRKNAR